MNNYLNKLQSNEEILIVKNKYINNNPYSHIILDDFVKKDFLNSAILKLDGVSEFVNKKHFDPNEKRKRTSPNEKDIPNEFIELIRYFNSQTFLNYLQKITGIKDGRNLMPKLAQHPLTELAIRKVKPSDKRYNCFDIKVQDLDFRVITYDTKIWLV